MSHHIPLFILLIANQAAHYDSIKKFIRGTVADNSPIIPISAQLKFNIDAINEMLCTKIPVPMRNFQDNPQLIVIRSFDVNKPGSEIEELQVSLVYPPAIPCPLTNNCLRAV